MSERIIQFPDLTEVDGVCSLEAEEAESIDTEFAFGTSVNTHDSIADLNIPIASMGFRALSSMNNWWFSHSGETRIVTLWWKRMCAREDSVQQISERTSWSEDNHFTENKPYIPLTQASGCGFLLGEPPLRSEIYHRFFSLLRLPLQMSTLRTKWLSYHNYRHLDTGKYAQYWINGWSPERYSFDLEKDFWKGRGISLNAREDVPATPPHIIRATPLPVWPQQPSQLAFSLQDTNGNR